MNKRWMIKPINNKIREFAKENYLSVPIAKILWDRNIKDSVNLKKFTNSSLDRLYDPFLMADMDKGTEIILSALQQEKNIVIYGDYDVDGVTSTTIMYKGLLKITDKIQFYIPDREKDGYGLNKRCIKELKEGGFELIITVDNGISAIEEVEYAKELGLTMVITDHHDVKEELPRADAVINPKRKDCSYPFKNLCGAAVAMKFLTALYIKLNLDLKFIYDELLCLAGIATVCDVVELIDENRIIVKEALKNLDNTKNFGLSALKDLIFKEGESFSVYNIGFKIGPCINATGRLENAKKSVELLLAKSQSIAADLAKDLVDINKERQELTIQGIEMLSEIVEKKYKKDKVILIYHEEIHESIAGIIAGRIKELYYKPVIVLTKGAEMPKGSARSIEGYDIHYELLKCDNLIEKFGGHPMAAGMSIREENIEPLRTLLNENCTLTEEEFVPKLMIDYPLRLSDISEELIHDIDRLEPFGVGNSSPVFADKQVKVINVFIYGEEKNVVKFTLEYGNLTYSGVSFNTLEKLQDIISEKFGENSSEMEPMKKGFKLRIPENLYLDIVYIPNFNQYMGRREVSLKIQDFRIS